MGGTHLFFLYCFLHKRTAIPIKNKTYVIALFIKSRKKSNVFNMVGLMELKICLFEKKTFEFCVYYNILY